MLVITAFMRGGYEKTGNYDAFCDIIARWNFGLRETASVFEEATGGKLPIQWGARPERAREIMKIAHRGSPLPGWKQTISLAAGFTRLYESFKSKK